MSAKKTKKNTSKNMRSKMKRMDTHDFELAERGDQTSVVRQLSGPLKEEKELNVNKYMESREMSALQERINGVTTLPAGFYCMLFLLSGSWLHPSMIELARQETMDNEDLTGCISTNWFPNMHALPPLPVIAAGFSMILHSPFSFIYHWKYAHRLSGMERIQHWSRRMDQSMLHVYSSLLSYSFSGRVDLFAVNVLFNLYAIRCQFENQVRPRRNQMNLVISMLAWSLPILLIHDDYIYFGKLWSVLLLGFTIFITYPIGGWSHTLFHLIMLATPPMIMTYVPGLPACQEQLQFAARCAVLAESKLLYS